MSKYNPKTTLFTEWPEGVTTANERIGGWVANTGTWYPIDYIQLRDSFRDGYPVQIALDWIAQGTEAGALTSQNVYDTAFKRAQQWEQFAEDVTDYDGFWYNERHHYAFAELTIGDDEAGTYRALADAIWDLIEDNTPEARAERAEQFRKRLEQSAAQARPQAERSAKRTRKAVTKSKSAKKKAMAR